MKQILIIGGGTGGIMTAAQLLKKGGVKITLVDPSEFHYYQPAWTLVGADAFDFEKTKRTMASVMPKGVHWVKEFVDKLDPENNQVITQSGSVLTYDFLVLSPGIKLDNSLIKGLPEAIDKGVV
jgi:sulfide:quinone oxidoreductase